MEKDCYVREKKQKKKTWRFLTLPYGTASEPDVNSSLAKVMADSFTTLNSLTFSPLKYACVRVHMCCASPPSSTIYFPLSYPQNALLVCGKPHSSPPPQPCWLAVFCLLAAVMLLYSPVVIYLLIRPPAIFFSMNSIEELVKAFFFFSSPISGLGRKLSVQHYGLLFANFTILLHSLRGAIRLKRGQGNKRDTRLLNNIKEHTETQQYFVFLQGTLLFKIDVVGLKDSILIFFFLIHYQCLVTWTCLS